jgi:cell division protein FtsL
MKKSSKPAILFVMFYFAVATLFVLGYVGIKLNCEGLTKKKVLAEEELADKKNWKLNLTAEKQSLIGEERIVKIAEEELGMVKESNPILVLTVDKEKIDKISKEIKDKYE